MSKYSKYIKTTSLLIILVIVDQFAKLWAISDLGDHRTIPVIKGVLHFTYVENRGAAFGMLQGGRALFTIIGLLAVAVIEYLIIKYPLEKRFIPLHITLTVIQAGAIGNMIDRVLKGYVVDFIYFKLIDFPVFNVADIYVTLGAISAVVLILFVYKENELEGYLKKKGK